MMGHGIMEDMDVVTCAKYLMFLDPMPPVTAELDEWGSRYPSQKTHMFRWLNWQTQVYKGDYGRSKPNHSTKTTYNRFQNPGGLLWMAEALGEDEAVVRQAISAAKEAEKKAAKGDGKSRCKAFREVIPWERIGELLDKPEKWRIDPDMDYMIERMKRKPYPKRKVGYSSEFNRVLWQEGIYEEHIV